jgi:hypothetical protein
MMQEIRICLECEKEFFVNLNNKIYNKKFCSILCARSNNGKRNRGRKHSRETKIKMSLSNSGERNGFYGKKHSEEFIEKFKLTQIGKKASEETKIKMSLSSLGERNGFYGKHCSDEHKAKISKNHRDCKGEKNPMYGKGYKLRGDKNGGWCGGISENPYDEKFNQTLRNKIRKRDNYKCAICRENGKEVHHIDYNKLNSLKENLITLCHKDHMKTNFNRENWLIFFKNYMNEKFKY